MTSHPYWDVITGYLGVITLCVVIALAMVIGLVGTKWQHAREDRRRANEPVGVDPELEAEHRQLLAEEERW